VVLSNYPLQGIGKPGALTEALPMSWFYERINTPSSIILRRVSGTVAIAEGS
jgi:hypothetical protein